MIPLLADSITVSELRSLIEMSVPFSVTDPPKSFAWLSAIDWLKASIVVLPTTFRIPFCMTGPLDFTDRSPATFVWLNIVAPAFVNRFPATLPPR